MRSAFVLAIAVVAVAGAVFLFGPRRLVEPWASSWDMGFLPASEPAEPAATEAVTSTAGQRVASRKQLARSPAASEVREPATQRPERLEPGSGRRLANEITSGPTNSKAAREDVRVSVYYTQGCRYCTAARRFLTQKGIRFQSHDIEADPSARARQRALNPQGTVPTLEVDGQVLIGFNAQRIERAIDRAAQRRRGR